MVHSAPWLAILWFYKVTVQAVLLFGSETLCLAPATLRHLGGFHVKAARKMTGILPKQNGETWTYLKTAYILKAAWLHTIGHCVQVRCQFIARSIVGRHIFELCHGKERRRGTTPITLACCPPICVCTPNTLWIFWCTPLLRVGTTIPAYPFLASQCHL